MYPKLPCHQVTDLLGGLFKGAKFTAGVVIFPVSESDRLRNKIEMDSSYNATFLVSVVRWIKLPIISQDT